MTKKRGSIDTIPPSAFKESLERLKPLLPTSELPQLLIELEKSLFPAIRINPLKSSSEDAQKWSHHYGWELVPIPFCKTGYVVKKSEVSISRVIEHKMGNFYIQDAASMLPVELFDFSSLVNPLVLDLAASPGGKTTHIISNGKDRGFVIANDSNPSRIPPLRSVLQNWSAANVAITQFPGQKFGSWFPETFDLILLDAPCSMEGLRSTDAHPLRSITSSERTRLTQRQFSLLESATRSIKIGGQIVYSTCTLAPEEDEMVLDRLLQKYPDSVRVEKIPSSLKINSPALSGYQQFSFNPQVNRAIRLWPHMFGTAGFFAAKLTKLKGLSTPVVNPPITDLDKVGFFKTNHRECDLISVFFQGHYGFNLREWLDAQDLLLYQRGNKLIATPAQFINSNINLPFHSLGMTIAEQNPDGWQISHEFCSRFGREFTSGFINLPEDRIESWQRGEDQKGLLPPRQQNPIVVVFDSQGTNLGRGKILTDRVKNLLPRHLI